MMETSPDMTMLCTGKCNDHIQLLLTRSCLMVVVMVGWVGQSGCAQHMQVTFRELPALSWSNYVSQYHLKTYLNTCICNRI
jgi:hypothetical protein